MLTANAAKAVQEWEKNHTVADGMIPVDGCFLKKLPMVLFFRDGDAMPWSVQYNGNGHYFKTREEADEYIEKRTHRKWMREYQKTHGRPSHIEVLRRRYYADFLIECAKNNGAKPPEEVSGDEAD